MSPSDTNTDAAVERLAGYVGGTGQPNSDLCDWSTGHLVSEVGWPALLLNDAFIIAGVGLILWLMLRKRKRPSD